MEAISLFSGCGGSDAGVIQAGFSVVMANDVLPYARDVYAANHPATEFVLGDVARIEKYPRAELLIGCYPCQGFSQGGLRNPAASINKLYLEFARALRIVRPRAFIVENVSGMIRSNFNHLLQDQLKTFGESGYKVKFAILNSANYGVAQERKRIFIVGIRNDFNIEYEFPKPTHGIGLNSPFKSIKDAIGDLPLWPDGEFYAREFHWYYMSRNRRQNWNDVSKTIVSSTDKARAQCLAV
jgi:DNA (cytosine-5)-methyltransferase 1